MSKKGGGKEAFLNSLLTPEQQAEYARSQEEQRTGRAEEYAQRKVRKLNNDLSLSEEQKDKLFQAYAQQKLTATDSAKQPEGGDVIRAAVGGAISFASVTADGAGGAEPIEIELDAGDFISPGSSDLDREHGDVDGRNDQQPALVLIVHAIECCCVIVCHFLYILFCLQ